MEESIKKRRKKIRGVKVEIEEDSNIRIIQIPNNNFRLVHMDRNDSCHIELSGIFDLFHAQILAYELEMDRFLPYRVWSYDPGYGQRFLNFIERIRQFFAEPPASLLELDLTQLQYADSSIVSLSERVYKESITRGFEFHLFPNSAIEKLFLMEKRPIPFSYN